MFLTDELLIELTGKKRRKQQMARLRELGIPFIPSATGRPIVAMLEIERRLVLGQKIRVKDRPRLELVR